MQVVCALAKSHESYLKRKCNCIRLKMLDQSAVKNVNFCAQWKKAVAHRGFSLQRGAVTSAGWSVVLITPKSRVRSPYWLHAFPSVYVFWRPQCNSFRRRRLAFLAKGTEYKSREALLQLYKALVRRQLCAILVSLFAKGYIGLGGSTEKVHQVDTGDEGVRL